MAGVEAAGFTHCTPIQEKVLPLSLAGKDVAGQAQTGTGKTAAFLITIFTRLLERERSAPRTGPRALVIAPTRELVVQITNDARLLGEATPFTIHAVYGGVDYKKQRDQVQAGTDLLVGTPGRLIDYHRQQVLDLRGVEVLVIDEADRMFDMGFIKDLRYLLRRLPPYARRQSMLFPATLGYDVMELAYVFMNDAEKVSVTPEQVTAEGIEHLVYHVGSHEKLPLLIGLMRRMTDAHVLVFTNMKRTAERLERNLMANGFSAAAITGTSINDGGCASWASSGAARSPFWWRRTSRHAGCTSRVSPTASTTTCPSIRRTTSIAPAVRHVPARPDTRSRWRARSTSRGSRRSKATSDSSCRTTSRTTACWRTTCATRPARPA